MKLKEKKCKYCKGVFTPFRILQSVCSFECSIYESKEKADRKKAKEWRKEKQKRKEALKTNSDYVRELQTIFNKFIRLRDKGLNCISCGKPAKKENAGHYRSRGGNPELAIEELNCHLQCEYCNTFLHGNLIDYRINLITKIGLEKVEWLEGKHEPKKHTIEELKVLKEYYKNKIKEIENKD
ncbi:MAG: recombination protein NinG [Flavobacteriaceae bacterium]|nr:recombination protein NinG [Flavobacteriaceae bacterium]